MPKKQKPAPKHEVTKRRLARWQREKRRRHIVFLVGGLVAAVVVAVIVWGVYATQVAPSNQLLSQVDGTSIRASDYVKVLRMYSSYQLPADGLLGILEDNELVRQAAPTFDVAAPTPAEITDAIKTSLFPDDDEVTDAEFEEKYHQMLDAFNISSDDFREFIGASLLRSRLVDYWTGQQAEAALQVHAQGILVGNSADAQTAISRLEAGEDFASVATELSLDMATKENGGDLGWFPQGVKATELDDVAFSLEPGVLSEPISTSDGYWIIQVLEKEDNRPLDDSAKQQLGAVAFNNWLDSERQQKIERKVDAAELQEVHDWATDKIS